MFFRCSRMLSVSPPSPMEVKKLMLKRMLRGVSCKHGHVPHSAETQQVGHFVNSNTVTHEGS